MQPEVYLYFDNSNIFVSAKGVAEVREGRFAREAVRLEFENLILLALAGRRLAKAFVVGSIGPEQRTVWQRLTTKTGIVPELYERGSLSGGEQGLDQCLQVHMLRAINDNADPQIAVLLTGDGAGYDVGAGFHADLERIHAAGWGIEVLSWDHSCRGRLRSWAATNGCFIKLDDHYSSVTFLEGARRAAAVDLSARPVAQVRENPVQRALADLTQRHDREIARLQSVIDGLRTRSEATKAGRDRFLRKQAGRARKGPS